MEKQPLKGGADFPYSLVGKTLKSSNPMEKEAVGTGRDLSLQNLQDSFVVLFSANPTGGRLQKREHFPLRCGKE